MVKPYYFQIRDPQEFLRYYLSIYKGDYHNRRAQKIISLFPDLRDKSVLDVGCGGGFYSVVAHRKKCKYLTLADSSLVCVKAAKLNLLENAPLDSEGVVADAANLPFRNGCFGFVSCIDLIEHVHKDNVLLNEIRRVLKDNGFMLVATQNSNSVNYILEALIQRRVLKKRSWMGWDPTHVRFYNPKRLCQLLRTSGFSYVKIAGTYFLPYLLALLLRRVHKRTSEIAYHILMILNERLEQNLKAFWNLFGWGIICLCVKSKDRY